jgi:hypothetical protein
MRYRIVICLLLFNYCCFGQAKIKQVDFKFNSIGNESIILDLVIQLPESETINDETFNTLNTGLTQFLKSTGNTVDVQNITVHIAPAINNTIRMIITNFDQDQVKTLFEHGPDCFILTSAPIHFTSTAGKSYEIGPAEVKQATLNSIKLNSAAMEEIIQAKGGAVYSIKNNIDFGVIPSANSDSEHNEYYVRFGYHSVYPLKNLPIFLFAEGLLTTQSDDSLNYVNIYPLNYKLSGKLSELVAQLGVEGNQRFTNFRSSGSLYWQGLLPNLLDFTMGEDRLRLKPVLKTGVKLYQEFKNNRPPEINKNEFSNQFFAEIYYYIPIKKIYSAILQLNTFYDTNKDVNPHKELKYNYSLTLGIEIPKTEFKTIFKYTAGENGINYQKDQLFLIGFMADLFSK